MIIVGAGMSGLLAAAMLRDEVSSVFEAQGELPNNHSAVLRFKTRVMSDALNIPFKEVDVLKSTVPWRNPVADALAYSRKTNGSATLRSIVTAENKTVKRYIAPPDLVDRMAKKVSAQICYGVSFNEWDAKQRVDSAISTLPMHMLMKLLKWEPKSEFSYNSGHNIVIDLKGYVNAYCSLYTPDPELPFSRLSLTGSQLIAECTQGGHAEEGNVEKALHQFGFTQADVVNVEVKRQRYAKILPIDEGERQRFIMWASEEFGIYSLGRYATWRPELLMDDCVKDVRVIHRLISNEATAYPHKLKEQNHESGTDRLHGTRHA